MENKKKKKKKKKRADRERGDLVGNTEIRGGGRGLTRDERQLGRRGREKRVNPRGKAATIRNRRRARYTENIYI